MAFTSTDIQYIVEAMATKKRPMDAILAAPTDKEYKRVLRTLGKQIIQRSAFDLAGPWHWGDIYTIRSVDIPNQVFHLQAARKNDGVARCGAWGVHTMSDHEVKRHLIGCIACLGEFYRDEQDRPERERQRRAGARSAA